MDVSKATHQLSKAVRVSLYRKMGWKHSFSSHVWNRRLTWPISPLGSSSFLTVANEIQVKERQLRKWDLGESLSKNGSWVLTLDRGRKECSRRSWRQGSLDGRHQVGKCGSEQGKCGSEGREWAWRREGACAKKKELLRSELWQRSPSYSLKGRNENCDPGSYQPEVKLAPHPQKRPETH